MGTLTRQYSIASSRRAFPEADGLLVAGVRAEADAVRRAPRQRIPETIAAVVHRTPIVSAVCIQIALLVACILTGLLDVSVLARFATAEPGEVLLVAWQVQSAFVSIAFAGLAVLVQLASEPVVTARSVREVLFRHTWFMAMLSFALSGTIQLGAVAIWFPSDEALVIEFVGVVAATVTAVAFAYKRAADVFSTPGKAYELGTTAIIEDALSSLSETWATAEGQRRLEEVVPRAWFTAVDDAPTEVVAVAPRDAEFQDVRLGPLRDVVQMIDADSATVQARGPSIGVGEGAGQATGRAKLRLLVGLGASVTEGQAIFVLESPEQYCGDRLDLGRRLAEAVWWGPSV